MLNESLSLVGQILILEPRPGGEAFPRSESETLRSQKPLPPE
jgi:hypothetical protein